MSSSDYTYVIPPYILNTCYGLELQKSLSWVNPELARSNQFSSSSGYSLRSPHELSYPPNCFSNDPVIDEIIKKKLVQKFSVLGVLGNSPSESIPDSYLFELYEIFQSRLSANDADSKQDLADAESVEKFLAAIQHNSSHSGPASGIHTEIWGYPQSVSSSSKTSTKSVFDNTDYGEFTFHNLAMSEKSKILENLPLSALFAWTKKTREHKYFYRPYLMHDKKFAYQFRLPMYWCPLYSGQDLQLMEGGFGLEPAFENGLSVLRLKMQKGAPDLNLPSRKKRFYNFVSNTEILSSAGIFYYEVTIDQTASSSTSFRPIIYTNDSSISSGSSLLFNMGFSKRFIKFDKIPSTSSLSSASSSNLDLKSLLFMLSQNDSNSTEKKLDDETITFLGAEPGVSLEGSLAISFNNSCSYASMKTGDNTYRSSSLNLNRRISQLNRHNQSEQEASKLDIDAPFHMHSKSADSGKKLFKSDIVGFGVNFITKTLFITLNGILVKTITDEEIISSNKYKDSIFDSSDEISSLYPIIGFQLSDILGNVQDGEPPESKITTNFGLKPFSFNIDGYVKALKDEQKLILSKSISEEIKTVSFKNTSSKASDEKRFAEMICNVNNNPDVLNSLIKGYLVHEVYMNTHEALEADISELNRNTDLNLSSDDYDLSIVDEKSSIAEESYAEKRQRLKRLILSHEFIQALNVIEEEFGFLSDKEYFQFELELSNLIKLLRLKLDKGSFEKHLTLNEEVFQCSKKLLKQTQFDIKLSSIVGELVGVLLLNNPEEISDLPEAQVLLANFEADTELLADYINQVILKQLGLNEESKLQSLVKKVGENIIELSQVEESFKMINFEKDYMEL